MNDQEIREMIRASIARHAPSPLAGVPPAARGFGDTGSHPSFARLPLLKSGDDDGACIIEPSVRCNHCGYCLSYGH